MYHNDSTVIDQASGLRERVKLKPVQVIAVTAGKGGVGKTNISVNVSLALAKKNKKVLLLDADLGLANIDVLLGLSAQNNLSHVIQGQCQMEDIILEGPQGLKVIPASSGTDKMTQLSMHEHLGIINAFNELTEDLDYLIIDTAAGISDTVLSFARSSQELLVVVCDEPTSLTDAYALIKVMSKRYGWQKFHILANMVRSPKEGRDLFNKLHRVTEHFLDVTLDYLGAIPFDEKLRKAVRKQKPVLEVYPQSEAAFGFNEVSEKINKWPISNKISGNTSFFIERLVNSKRVDMTDNT